MSFRSHRFQGIRSRIEQACLIAFIFFSYSLHANEDPLGPKPTDAAAATNLPFKVTGPGKFELGNIRMNTEQRTVSFPATLNRAEGPMEYFLVTSQGKTHESILRTDAKPEEIHIAMLLLGAQGAGTNVSSENVDGGPVSNPSRQTMPGDPVTIAVKWTVNGEEIRRTAEDLIFNDEIHSTPKSGGWVYNGSVVWRGKFFAQVEGSIVSLITDPIALINNIGAGHDNDRIWTVNTNKLPPAEVPLEVTFQLNDRVAKK